MGIPGLIRNALYDCIIVNIIRCTIVIVNVICCTIVFVNFIDCTIVFPEKKEERNRKKEEENNVVEFGSNLNVFIIILNTIT